MSTSQHKPSVTTHPLFPAIVALWFATLFGLGFAVLPASLLERITGSIGLPAILASAAPPLGQTARILLSVATALIGGGAGYGLARLLAPRNHGKPATRTRSIRPQEAAPPPHVRRRPISALEELGSPALDTPPEAPPFPDEQSDHTPEPVAQAPAEENPEESWAEEASQLFVAQQVLDPEPARPVTLEAESIEPAEPEPETALWQDYPVDLEEAPVEAQFEAAPVAEESFASEDAIDAEFEPVVDEPAEPEENPLAEPEATSDPEHAPLPTDQRVPLDRLGMVELTERLGANVQKRMALGKAPPEGLTAAIRREIEQPAKPAQNFYQGVEARLSDPLADLDDDFEDDDETLIPASVPDAASMTAALRNVAMALNAREEEELEEDGDEEEYEEDDQDEEATLPRERQSYSSLLNVKPSFRVPTEAYSYDENGVPRDFANDSAAAPYNADQSDAKTGALGPQDRHQQKQALRSALGSLQKFSGNS